MKKRLTFTLIEVLLAVFILEIGVLAIATFYSYGFTIIKTARNETTASNLVSALLDSELSKNYDNIGVGLGVKQNYTNDPLSPFYPWQKQVDVAYIDINLNKSTTDPNMKKITATIYWQDKGVEKSLQTASIKARH